MPSSVRVTFTTQHDSYLYKYLANYCKSKEGRSGNKVYQNLTANADNLWPWHVHHTWQSWRERYIKNKATFDAYIRQYQQKHGIDPEETKGKKRAADPTPIEMLGKAPKRMKIQEDATRETRARTVSAGKSKSKQTPRKSPAVDSRPSTSPRTDQDATEKPYLDLPHRSPLEAPSSSHEEAQPSTPPRASTDATEGPDLLPLQTGHDMLEMTSMPETPTPLSTDVQTQSCAAKRAKIRPRTPSDLFISDAESETGKEASVPQRAPPRLVNLFQGQVLVDQMGHVPHAIIHAKAEEEVVVVVEEEEEEEEEKEVEAEVETKEKWPPIRGVTAERTKTARPDAKVETHHAFSQPQLPSQPEVLQEETMTMDGRGRGKPHGVLPDRRTVVAQFLGQRPGVVPQVEGGSSPVKPIVPTTEPPEPMASLVAKPTPKFPAPRASTQSPFGPEPSSEETLHPLPSRTRAARHPALDRIRRQTIGHVESGHEDEERREQAHVPSIDFVELSRASSRSSTRTSVPARPPRWSLPAFAMSTPWLFNEAEGAHSAPESETGSSKRSPFRWAAPSPVNIWGRRAQTGSSAPLFMSTPSPAHSATAVATSTNNDGAPQPDVMVTSTTSTSPLSVAPHAGDVQLVASHGLASLLAHMSANHGLAMSVVEAVYARVGSLREADEVLKGMRETAERFGQREIEKRERRRRNRGSERGRRVKLRYAVTSEDGEPEYSPPETSRAAMWKRQTEVAKSGEEESREEEDGDGRTAQELEMRMGKGRYRRDIVRRFI